MSQQPNKEIVSIHGDECKFEDIRESVENAKQSFWTRQIYKRPIALVEKGNGTLRTFVGQEFDPEYFEISDTAWTHDHCAICSYRIDDSEPRQEAYSDGYNWICYECFNQFLIKDHVTIDLSDIKSIEELHLMFKKELYFPQFYGENWDAFWDSIRGLTTMPTVLTLTGWKEFENNFPNDSRILKEQIADYNKSNSEQQIEKV
jgi:ribonuclease inhibitor